LDIEQHRNELGGLFSQQCLFVKSRKKGHAGIRHSVKELEEMGVGSQELLASPEIAIAQLDEAHKHESRHYVYKNRRIASCWAFDHKHGYKSSGLTAHQEFVDDLVSAPGCDFASTYCVDTAQLA